MTMPRRISLHREHVLPSCINWKWIETTSEGKYLAHYCQNGQCRDLGLYEDAMSANQAVLQAIRRHIHEAISDMNGN